MAQPKLPDHLQPGPSVSVPIQEGETDSKKLLFLSNSKLEILLLFRLVYF